MMRSTSERDDSVQRADHAGGLGGGDGGVDRLEIAHLADEMTSG